jgi:peptidoglycan lytic transglycosylase D
MVKATPKSSCMTIRGRFALVALVFSSVLTSGTVLPATAEPLLNVSDLEYAAVPPQGDDLGRLDLWMEPGLAETGSGAEPTALADVVSPLLLPAVIDDPWAEAFADSARAGVRAVPAVVAPYHVTLNSQVKAFLDRFTGDRRQIVGMWLERSTRYLGMIRDVLRNRGLPEDLAFTAMIESGYNPLAVSRAGAKGLWQFMAATARRYGLRVDEWVDERLDPEKSTSAAASYLRDLHVQFGSWALAQAAYNAGEVTVTRAIRATRSTDFWVLARTKFLRQETKEFVPQIHAATMIGREPARYGFEPVDVGAAAFDRVSVPPSTDLRRLSSAAGVSKDALLTMNPVLVQGVTPPGRPYDLKIPVGSRPDIVAALVTRTPVASAGPTAVRTARQGTGVHVVRPHDTVSTIARRYGISVTNVLQWNSLERRDLIKPGDRLRVADLRAERDARAVR